jgi:two-component system, NarL family, sensor histidine kinase DesK
MEELSRICAAARADARLVTSDGRRLSFAGEVDAARQILAVAGVRVQVSIPAGPLPAAADEVLAPVLREAVTNILRHSAATSATIAATAAAGTIEMAVSNDGAAGDAGPDGSGRVASAGPASGLNGLVTGRGSGLANLAARVQAVGGEMTSRRRADQFELTARIPLDRPSPAGPVIAAAQAGHRDLPPAR